MLALIATCWAIALLALLAATVLVMFLLACAAVAWEDWRGTGRAM